MARRKKVQTAREVAAGPVSAVDDLRHGTVRLSTRDRGPSPGDGPGLGLTERTDETEDEGETEADVAGDVYWPEDKPLPTHYVKRRMPVIPCPVCRRTAVRVAGMLVQAVVCRASGAELASFYCRGCDARFGMPVRIMEDGQ